MRTRSFFFKERIVSLDGGRSKKIGAVPYCLLLSLALAGAALPQESAFSPKINKTADGISYVSTGIGKESRENLPQFPLMLIFSTRNSRYLANVECEISPGPRGEPTRIRSIGPWLLVDLRPGEYSVKARTVGGQEVSKSFKIESNRSIRVNLIWNLSDEDI